MNATPSILIFFSGWNFFCALNMALVHLFCFTLFFKYTFSRKFFLCKRLFWTFFSLIKKLCSKTKFEIDVTPSFYNLFSFFSSTPTNLRICFVFGDFVQFLQKKMYMPFRPFFNSPSEIFTHFFFNFCFFLKGSFLSNLSIANFIFNIDPLITILENFCTPYCSSPLTNTGNTFLYLAQ